MKIAYLILIAQIVIIWKLYSLPDIQTITPWIIKREGYSIDAGYLPIIKYLLRIPTPWKTYFVTVYTKELFKRVN